jgi:nudix-type nucleoside diphosphatase (YffH/AdpP family)
MKFDIESSRRILDDVFQVDESYVRFERFDGSIAGPVRCLRFVRDDSVAAILFHRALKHVILVQQFRYPTCEAGWAWTIETVAGSLDPEETPEAGMRREIEEETGYRVEAMESIATFFVSPGGSTERVFLFYAEIDGSDRVSIGGGVTAGGEDIRILSVSLDEARQLLVDGKVADAKTIIGLQWLLASRTAAGEDE